MNTNIFTVIFVAFCLIVVVADYFNWLNKLSEYCAKDSKSILNDYEKTNLD